MARDNQNCLEKFKSIHKKINEEIEDKRWEFLDNIYDLIINWEGELPNLRDILRPDEIDWLLTKAAEGVMNQAQAISLINFVMRTGYKDEPVVDVGAKPCSRRTTLVHHAFRSEQYYIAPDLFRIYDRFDVNYTDKDGLTHFHVACRYGCYDVVEKFLELGQVDPNLLVTETGESPLHLAIISRNKEVIELLLRNGADPTWASKNGWTPLHFVSSNLKDSTDLAKMLFEMSDERYGPVQVDARNKFGNAPLHFAANYGHKDLMEFLLRGGADPNIANKKGWTPLHIVSAVLNNSKDVAKMLFDVRDERYGPVQVNARTDLGNAPLHIALDNGHKDLIEFLLRNSANPNIANKEGATPLHIICNDYRYDDSELAELLFKICKEVDQLVQVDVRDNKGQTPLQWAVANLLPNAIDVLLDNGADLSNFVFPTGSYCAEGFEFTKKLDETDMLEFKFRAAARALVIVQRLEERGYQLDRIEALTIMKFFAKYELFEKSTDSIDVHKFEKSIVEDTKKIMIKDNDPSLTLYDLILLRPEEAAKLVTYEDYLDLANTYDADWPLYQYYQMACVAHICEKLSKGFFRRWTLDFFLELTRYELPILCCEIILKELMNEDLCNVCLAATGQHL